MHEDLLCYISLDAIRSVIKNVYALKMPKQKIRLYQSVNAYLANSKRVPNKDDSNLAVFRFALLVQECSKHITAFIVNGVRRLQVSFFPTAKSKKCLCKGAAILHEKACLRRLRIDKRIAVK